MYKWKKYTWVVYVLILMFSIFLSYISIFRVDDIEKGRIYSLYVRADGNLEVLSIDGKNVDKRMYLQDSLDYGYYTLEYIFKGKKGKIIYAKEDRLNTFRRYIKESIEKGSNDYEVKAFTKAVILGEKNGLDSDFKNDLRYLGLSHILSISGLHLSITLIFLEKIFSKFNSKDKIVFFFITIYCLIIGFGVSIKRVYIMYVAKIFLESSFNRYMLSLIIVLAGNVFLLLDAGFIYSYLSVFVLLFLAPQFKKKIENRWIYTIFTFLSLQLILMPFNYYFSKNIPLLSFVINLIMLPFVEVFIQLLFISTIFNLVGIYFFDNLVKIGYNSLRMITESLAKIKYISIGFKSVNLNLFVILVVLVILIYLYLYELLYERRIDVR